jgi:sodium pump decarboxylase gamma subunit
MPPFEQGLVISVTGIGGVFTVLLALMLMVMAIGAVFGKKPARKKIEGGKAAASDDKQQSASPKPAQAQKE